MRRSAPVAAAEHDMQNRQNKWSEVLQKRGAQSVGSAAATPLTAEDVLLELDDDSGLLSLGSGEGDQACRVLLETTLSWRELEVGAYGDARLV